MTPYQSFNAYPSHTAQPISLVTTHENHRTDMNIFSFNTQESRSRPCAVKFFHSNELFKRVTDFLSITLKIVFVTSDGSPTIRIGISIHCACRGKCLLGGDAVQETGNGNIASWLHPGDQGPLPQRA